MNGPDHYRVAEKLTEDAGAVMDYDHGMYASMDTGERIKRQAALLAAAQVHATLALAAAAALNDPQGGMGGNDWHAWHDAVSVDAMKVSEGLL
jgi:hypothetical protein